MLFLLLRGFCYFISMTTAPCWVRGHACRACLQRALVTRMRDMHAHAHAWPERVAGMARIRVTKACAGMTRIRVSRARVHVWRSYAWAKRVCRHGAHTREQSACARMALIRVSRARVHSWRAYAWAERVFMHGAHTRDQISLFPPNINH